LVRRIYHGVDGYTPIALYLGSQDWSRRLELLADSHQSELETDNL